VLAQLTESEIKQIHLLEGMTSLGSVKWPDFNQGVCVSCTSDSGMYSVFDTRQDAIKPALRVNTEKEDLWTHERYSDHNVLLGFGDGEIHHMDMRAGDKILHRVVDPYVQGVGNLHFHASSRSVVSSGFTDFCVWKPTTSRQLSVWCHSSLDSEPLENAGQYNCTAVWANESTVLVTDNKGNLKVIDL